MRRKPNEAVQIKGLSIEVKNGRFESALRKLKKRIDEDGRLQEVRDRKYFQKKSDKKRRAKELAVLRYKRSVKDQEKD